MKKALLALVLVFAVSSMAAAVDAKFFGYNWLNYTVSYSNADLVSSKGTVKRTYLGWKLKYDEDLSGMILLDINNYDGAQGDIDWAIWLKVIQLEYKILENLKIRAGVQLIPFGMNDLWKYPLISYAFEVRNGRNKV